MTSPDEYCQAKAAASGSSFYYSFRFLPEEQRQAITALYAFCREVDDIVDECSDRGVAEKKILWWQEEVQRLFADQARHPISQALTPVIRRYALQQAYFEEILDGMMMDLYYKPFQRFSDLSLYCYRVASAVGLLAIEIFGYQNRQTRKFADHLGTALQLVNILRDVKEDVQRGYVYIPQEELALYAVSKEMLLGTKTTESLSALFSLQAERARQYFSLALKNLPDEDRFSQVSSLIMANIYLVLLDELENDGFRMLEYRLKLTPLRKFWIAWRTYTREKQRWQKFQKTMK